MNTVGDLLLILFLLFLLRRDVKHFLFLLDPEDDAEDLIVAVCSDASDEDEEDGEDKTLLMTSSI